MAFTRWENLPLIYSRQQIWQIMKIEITETLQENGNVWMDAVLYAHKISHEKGLPLVVAIDTSIRDVVISYIRKVVRALGVFDYKLHEVYTGSYIALHKPLRFESIKFAKIETIGIEGFHNAILLSVGVHAKEIYSWRGGDYSRILIVPKLSRERAVLEKFFPSAISIIFPKRGRKASLGSWQRQSLNWYSERYLHIAFGVFRSSEAPKEIGKGLPKICRYCGKSSADNAKKVSHGFPEQIGNKVLIDLLECGTCNTFFGEFLERDFGNWSHLPRVVSQIGGKTGIASYHSDDGGVKLENKNGIRELVFNKSDEGDVRITIDNENKKFLIEVEVQPYVPLAVFKTFIKMALCVIPEEFAKEMGHLKGWILEKTHEYENSRWGELSVIRQFIPGQLPNDIIAYMLLKRREGIVGCHTMWFIIQFGNFLYQVPIPSTEKTDSIGIGNKGFMPYFSPWLTPEHERIYGKITYTEENLSSTTCTTLETRNISYSFESAVEVKNGDDN